MRTLRALGCAVVVAAAVSFGETACTGEDLVPSTPLEDGGEGTDGNNPGTQTCTPAQFVCTGPELRRCKDDGPGPDTPIATCASEALCNAGKDMGVCKPPACDTAQLKCEGSDFFACLPDRTGFSPTKTGTCSGATPACVDGKCVVCVDGTGDCVGKTPRKCVNNAWVDDTPCAGQVSSVCALGECIDARVARWPMPNEPTNAKNPAKYSNPSPNVVLDEVTGLEWTKALGPAALLVTIRQYCETLTVDGKGGWHMPSLIELLSLVDYSRLTSPPTQPLIDTTVFPGAPNPGFIAIGANSAVQTNNFVNFTTGYLTVENPTGNTYPVRCVRPTKKPPAGPRFTVVGGDAKDNYTGLTWPTLNSSNMNNYGPAATKCASTGYRVPTVKELFTLIDPADTTAPLIDTTVFTDARDDGYWAITPANAGARLVVAFGVPGTIVLNTDTNALALRCVK